MKQIKPKMPKRWPARLRTRTATRRARSVRHAKHWRHHAFTAFLGSALALAIVTALLFLRLSAGPINLTFAETFIRGTLQNAMKNESRSDFSKLQLEWADSRLRLRVRDFNLKRSDGTLIAQSDIAYLGFSPLALLSGQLEPSVFDIRSPVLALTIEVDSTLTLGGAPVLDEAERVPLVALLDADLITRLLPYAQNLFNSGSMHSLRLDNAKITLLDKRTSHVRQFEAFTVALKRTPARSFEIALTSPQPGAPWALDLVLGPVEKGQRDVQLSTRHFTLASLGLPPDVEVSAAPLQARLSTRVSETGLVRPLSGTVQLGAGRTKGADFDFTFAPLTLNVELASDARNLTIAPAAFQLADIKGQFEGSLLLPATNDPTWPVRIHLTASALRFGKDEQRYEDIDRLSFSATYEARSQVLWIDRLTAGTQTPVVELKGSARFANSTPALQISAWAKNLSLKSFIAVWPSPIIPAVRQWMVDQVDEGYINEASVDALIPGGWLDGRPLLRDFVRSSWTLSKITLRPVPRAPPVSGVTARVDATGNSAKVEAQNGRMEMAEGVIILPNTVFTADNFYGTKPAARADVVAVGPLAALAAFAEAQGVDMAYGNADVKALKGEGLVSAHVRVPLWRAATLDDVRVNLEAEVRDVSGTKFVDGRDLSQGSFRIKSEGGTIKIDGSAQVDGQITRLLFTRDGDNTPQLRAEIDTDEKIRTKLGLDLSPFATGPAVVRLIKNLKKDSADAVEVDLTQAQLNITPLALNKPRGSPATLSFVPRGDKQKTLEDLVLRGNDWFVRGKISLDDKNEMQLGDFTDIHLRADDHFAARIEKKGSTTVASVTGRSLDTRPFLTRIMSDGAGDGAGRTELNVRLDQAVGHNRETLQNLRLNAVTEGARLLSLELDASFDRGKVVGDILSDQGRPYVMVTSNDGGNLLRFMNIYTHMQGGRFTLTQTLNDPTGRTAEGILAVENFALVNEPAMQRLFGASPPAQAASGVQRPPENNVDFDRLRVVYSRAPGAIQVREGVLRNPAIGMNVQGQLNFTQDTISLQGTFLPLYALNNLVARLPVVGMFMGGQEEGLLGVNFAINGTLGAPTLRVNPMSIIAPGFLRGIFQYQNDQNRPNSSPASR